MISFFNYLPTTIDSSETPNVISVINPFTGYTSKGINIGSDISAVKSIYGSPGSQTTGSGIVYFNDNLGVQFWTSTSSTFVEEIDIYAPVTSQSKAARIDRYRMIPFRNRHKK